MMFLKPSTNPLPAAVRRLQKEYEKIKKDPTEGIYMTPNEENILEWDFCLKGSAGTDFKGGYYHGKLLFRPNFPFAPPTIYMITPNGRFRTDTRLCLSISDFHPESWNPGWTIPSILIGLLSFMNDGNSFASGAIITSSAEKARLAEESLHFNLRNETFVTQFPEIVDEINRKLGLPKRKQDGTDDEDAKKPRFGDISFAMTSADAEQEQSASDKSPDDIIEDVQVAQDEQDKTQNKSDISEDVKSSTD